MQKIINSINKYSESNRLLADDNQLEKISHRLLANGNQSESLKFVKNRNRSIIVIMIVMRILITKN